MQRLVEAEIAHHRGDERAFRERPLLEEIERGDGHDVVAVHQFAVFVAEEHAIGVAVVGDPELGPGLLHQALNLRRESAAAVRVDVAAVRVL